jgi:malonyl-CoA/methylmalonyl-CoA synthetase
LIELWQFTGDDVLLHALPVYHTHGLFVGMNTVLFSGGRLLLHRKFSADAVMSDLDKVSCFMGVPTFYTRLLQHKALNLETTEHMRLFVSGSAPLLAETHAAFANRTGHAILERYGMTETNMIASNPYDGARRAGTVGFALPHVDVIITDPATGTQLPNGADGMIEVRGPNVFQGYWRNPEKTAEDLRANGFFITGDLGRIDSKGYLVISGRAKDLIITGGFNVYPKEIEEVIDALPSVIESAVIGLPHADFGEAVTAVVATAHILDEAQMIATLKTKLGGFKVPKRIVFVEDLPRNAMGKVQKAELRKRYAGLL